MDVESWSMKNMSYSLAFVCDVEEELEVASLWSVKKRRVRTRWS